MAALLRKSLKKRKPFTPSATNPDEHDMRAERNTPPQHRPTGRGDLGTPLTHPREYVPAPPSKGTKKSSTVGKLLAGMAIGGAVAGTIAYLTRQEGSARTAGRTASQGTSPIVDAAAEVLPKGEPIKVKSSIEIDVRPSLVYAQWRKLENLPHILSHLEAVREEANDRSYWQAKGPAGTSVSWYARMDADVPAERISWSSEPDADVPNQGVVRFESTNAGIGTNLTVELTYQPPGGKLAQLLAAAFGENPQNQIDEDLRTFRDSIQDAHRKA